jgi:hypothetical protein
MIVNTSRLEGAIEGYGTATGVERSKVTFTCGRFTAALFTFTVKPVNLDDMLAAVWQAALAFCSANVFAATELLGGTTAVHANWFTETSRFQYASIACFDFGDGRLLVNPLTLTVLAA